jgi:hypothetical protein
MMVKFWEAYESADARTKLGIRRYLVEFYDGEDE